MKAWWRGRGIERPNDVEVPVSILHHHKTVAGEILWHSHQTKLYRHPFPYERAHRD